MNEYRAAVPKGVITGYAQDPNQQVSNAQGIDLNAPMTVSNAVNIGVAAVYGKKILSATQKAIVGQLGNSRLERGIEIGTKLITYVGIGVASGPAAVVTVPLAVLTDIAVKSIADMTESHTISLDNQRLVEERGTLMQLGAGGYYG